MKPTGRTRPTNNQLLYKAYFRWDHYTFRLREGRQLPEETEACASVTSAFLQVLSTLQAAEGRRSDAYRNILQMLSTNTRRTKVVELSSGTHRVADELKKHCLHDGEGGQYSTNLDRNRYGNDDQYLSTVIRYDLEFLDLCPCLVDVEVIDAKNGNESTLVSAGPDFCVCEGPNKKLAQREPEAAAEKAWPAQGLSCERAMSGRIQQHPAQSRGTVGTSGGSDLFDALLMAATGGTETAQALSAGEPPVTSKMHGSLPRQRSRLWHTPGSLGEVDSLQNALEAWKADEEIASGQHALDSPFRRIPSKRRFPRKGSFSNLNVVEDSGNLNLAMGQGNDSTAVGKERSAENGPERSIRSQEGDTEAPDKGAMQDAVADEAEGEGDDMPGPNSFPHGLVRSVHRQSSAVNLTNLSRLGKDAEIKRLKEELRLMREEMKALEGQLDDSKTKESQTKLQLDSSRREQDMMRSANEQYRDEITYLRKELQQVRRGSVDPNSDHQPIKRASSDGHKSENSERTKSEGRDTGDHISSKLTDAGGLHQELVAANSKIRRLESEKAQLETKLRRITSLAISLDDTAPSANSVPAALGPGLPSYPPLGPSVMPVSHTPGPVLEYQLSQSAQESAVSSLLAVQALSMSALSSHPTMTVPPPLLLGGLAHLAPYGNGQIYAGMKRRADETPTNPPDAPAAAKKLAVEGTIAPSPLMLNGPCQPLKPEAQQPAEPKLFTSEPKQEKVASPNRSSHSSSPADAQKMPETVGPPVGPVAIGPAPT